MSLNRTALRLATVLALTNGGRAPWPTMARQRVYDSRPDPLQLAAEHERAPVIIVTTDDDDGQTMSKANGGWPFERTVNLMIEIAVVGMARDPDSGESLVVKVETDPQISATLDALEWQVKCALLGPGAWADLWSASIKRLHAINSKEFKDPAGARSRFAERSLMYGVEIFDDKLPATLVLPVGADVPVPQLPDAVRRVVDAAAALDPPSPYVASVVALLNSGVIPPSAVLRPLEHLRFTEADAGGGKRPAGVADIHFPSGA